MLIHTSHTRMHALTSHTYTYVNALKQYAYYAHKHTCMHGHKNASHAHTTQTCKNIPINTIVCSLIIYTHAYTGMYIHLLNTNARTCTYKII